MGRELALKKALRELRDDYDVIMIDCPPALGLLTVNALVASDYALISAEAQYFALQGVEQALEVIELARENLNPDLEWLGVVLNIADMRTRHSREAFDSLRQHFGEKLLDTTIRQSIAYAESAERAVSILDYRPDLAADYLAVAEELLRRLGLDAPRLRVARDDERRRRFVAGPRCARHPSASRQRPRLRAWYRAGPSPRAAGRASQPAQLGRGHTAWPDAGTRPHGCRPAGGIQITPSAGTTGTRASRTPPTAPAAPPGTRRARRSAPSRRLPKPLSGPRRPPS